MVGSPGGSPLVIHLCAAVGAIENARQRIWLSVRLVNTPLRSPQPLNDIPCFFVNDLRVRVLEYKPVFGGGFPLLGFIVFRSRLVQDFPAHIFLFLEDVDDGGARPFIRVCIVRPAARPFADAFPMCVGGQYPLGGQFLRDFCDVLSRNHAPEYPLYNGSGFLVYDPFLAVFRVDCALDFEHESLFELNRLCHACSNFKEQDFVKLGAVCQMAKPTCAANIRQLAENLDQFDFAPNVHTPEEIGKYMIQQSGHYEYDENLEDFYNYGDYGVNRMLQEDGVFVNRGYVSYHGMLTLEELMRDDPAESHQQEQELQMM